MSSLILPPGMSIPKISVADTPQPEATDAERALMVPNPSGYKLLCVVPDVPDTFEGSAIVKADTVKHAEEQTTHTLYVLKVGPDAYTDKEKFPSGPWCKEGDFIMVRAYAGTRFRMFGKEFRLLNDDQVDGTVTDPRGIGRAY